jgi:hypothetical protein
MGRRRSGHHPRPELEVRTRRHVRLSLTGVPEPASGPRSPGVINESGDPTSGAATRSHRR